METLKKALEKKGYQVSCFQTAEECVNYLERKIDQTSVGIGGSATVREMGLFEKLKTHNTVYWHNDLAQLKEMGDRVIREKAAETEVYISSVNGMAESGEMINIDYNGNRIAANVFGHKKVYLIVGKNKIAPDFESALWRARNIAAPKNAKRLNRKTPCAVKGDRCYDCDSPERICRGFLVLERAVAGTETEVLLVEEELGY